MICIPGLFKEIARGAGPSLAGRPPPAPRGNIFVPKTNNHILPDSESKKVITNYIICSTQSAVYGLEKNG